MNKLYIATSIDGYIATNEHEVTWLEDFTPEIMRTDDIIKNSYNEFIKDIKEVVMGYQTYKFIIDSPHDWPYVDQKCYVVTSREINDEHVNAVSYDQVVDILKKSSQETWIVGGGKLFSSLLKDDVVDRIIITQMPIILGTGINLFNDTKMKKCELLKVNTSGNFIEYEYKIKA